MNLNYMREIGFAKVNLSLGANPQTTIALHKFAKNHIYFPKSGG
jgi:hypothetical protein